MTFELTMQFLKGYWPILLALAGIIWHLITQYFAFQQSKSSQLSFEKTTSENLKSLRDALQLHRKELDHEIEQAREKAEKDILKSKDEFTQKMEKIFEQQQQSNEVLIELKTGFSYIKEAIDELKKR
jgi:DNA anti-recombination protein RmuC